METKFNIKKTTNKKIFKDIFIYCLCILFLRNCKKIKLSKHAIKRAVQRRIDLDLVEICLQSGKSKQFGKNNIKFEKQFIKFKLVCIGKNEFGEIKILTIEKK